MLPFSNRFFVLQGIREDRNMLNKELKIFQKERDILQVGILLRYRKYYEYFDESPIPPGAEVESLRVVFQKIFEVYSVFTQNLSSSYKWN